MGGALGRWVARLLAGVGTLALLTVGAVAQEQRGPFQVPTKASEQADAPAGPTLELYPKSYALVIGIDNYDAGWPRLGKAIEDARAVEAVLRARGFTTELVLDPDRDTLENAFESFLIEKGADPGARLLVWFAGHGHSIGKEGYLVPRDAPAPSAGPAFVRKALSMRRFGEWARAANAKHVLAVFDSCFAGTIFQTARGTPPAAITAAVAEPVRQFLTSGDAGQEVSDDGRFRELFLAALDGREQRADANADGYLTGTELGFFLADRVTNLTNRQQTPRYGKLQDEAYDRGDFVLAAVKPIVVARPTPAPAAPAPVAGLDAGQFEIAFWDAIKNSRNPADHEAYLRRFPDGWFADLARNRLAELRPATPTPPAPVPTAPPVAVAPPSPLSPAAPSPAAIEAELKLTKDDRAQLQRALAALGFDPRGSDGNLGPKSRAAIAAWQTSKSEPSTSFLTAQQRAALLADAAPKLAALEAARLEEASRAPARGKVFRDCAVCPEMVVVPAGSFTMGSPDSEEGRFPDEGPQRRVTIAKPFAVGKYEVTFAEWDACVADRGCAHRPDDNGGGRGRRPVINVSWNDVQQQFLPWLSRKTGERYRLLSEAEWEYAARGITDGLNGPRYSWGNDVGRGKAYCDGCGAGLDGKRATVVGSFRPNEFGLFDMHGNVWEWVRDVYVADYVGAPSDGTARDQSQASRRVVRGGSFQNAPNGIRAAVRNREMERYSGYGYGFRVAKALDP